MFVSAKTHKAVLEKLDSLEKLLEICEKESALLASGDLQTSLPEDGTLTKQEILKNIKALRFRFKDAFFAAGGGIRNLSSSCGELNSFALEMFNSSCSVFQMAQSINSAADQIGVKTEESSHAASAMNSDMQDVNARAREASSNINGVAAAAEEMNATVGEIAKSASAARSMAHSVLSTIEAATVKVSQLGQAAEGIEQVIESINEVSEQTKLLALNATIEAARAGEAGKGFAVVANEVKELAKQTSESTGDIRLKVDAIRNAVDMIVDEIKHIHERMDEVNKSIDNIAAAVEEQSITSRDISSNINSAAGFVSDIAGRVDNATESINKISGIFYETASLVDSTVHSVAQVRKETENLKLLSGKVYASAMEVSVYSGESEKALKMIKLDIPAQGEHELIRFSPDYDVKVDELNRHHKKIMEYINSIHSMIKAGAAPASINKILKQMADFVVMHFGAEEKYFVKFGYKDYEAHKKIHDKLLGQVRDIVAKLDAGEEINMIALLTFLRDWLKDHIQGTDRKHSDFMNSNGLH